ncbi:MAG: heme lyase CcmF/NrfE family subunit [Thermincolia bacterium]
MADVGYLALIISFILAIYTIAGFTIYVKTGNQKILESTKGAVYAAAFLSTVAYFLLTYLFGVSDFSVSYVWKYSSTDLPWFYKLTAVWAGNDGSLLLWFWVLALYTAIVVYQNKIKDMTPYVGALLAVNSLFFLFVMVFLTNPFETLPYSQPEGQGLNPMLQNPGMVIHPVTTYLGYVGFAIPFAYAMAALIMKRSDDQWIKVTRYWTITAWLFLSLGNLTGAQWAYEELGWGGYWAWDPVENASLMPWLTGSAFLHSVMIQERKNMLKIWNIVLIIITFVLTLFGTFLVRSGVLTSVHAFGNSDLGKYFLAFTVAALVGSLLLLVDRLNMLKEDKEFESYISKESSFLLNNLVLVGIAFATFWGTIFPLVSEAVTGDKITVSIPFFNSVNAPLGLAMTLLLGICPLIAWRKASVKNLIENFIIPLAIAGIFLVGAITLGVLKYYELKLYAIFAFAIAVFALMATIIEFIKGTRVRMRMTGENPITAFFKLTTKNRRRYGGYVIHLGIIMMLFAIIGSNTYNMETIRNASINGTFKVRDYTVTYQNLADETRGKNYVVYADLSVSKDGKFLGQIRPERVQYPTHPQPATEPDILSSYKEDLYVMLTGWNEDGTATFKVLINPLVKWLWIGGYVIILGTIFALWPGKGSEFGPKYTQRS